MASGWDNAVWAPAVDPMTLPSAPTAEDMRIVYAELAKARAAEGSTYVDESEICSWFGAKDLTDPVMVGVRALGFPFNPLEQQRIEQKVNMFGKVTTMFVPVALRRDANTWMSNFLPAAEAAVRQQARKK